MLKQDGVCLQYSHWELQYPYNSPGKHIGHLIDIRGVLRLRAKLNFSRQQNRYSLDFRCQCVFFASFSGNFVQLDSEIR